MRHLMRGRHLGRKPAHLLALKRNLATALFAHERIITTVAKAKELRPFVEKIITMAKKGGEYLNEAGDKTDDASKAARAKALHYRRQIMTALGGKRFVLVKDENINVTDKLLKDIGPRFAERAGGYTRILKRSEVRQGDGGPTAFIEILGAGEESRQTTAAPAPVTKSES